MACYKYKKGRKGIMKPKKKKTYKKRTKYPGGFSFDLFRGKYFN